jgi:DNA-binding transcriptional LysR family regulator
MKKGPAIMKTSLAIFCKVVRTKSFTRAAEELYITQSAVSQHIRSLEKNYGIKLFVRSKSGAFLTPEGRILYEYAQQILTLYAKAAQDLSKKSGFMKGQLSIGASYTVGEYILPPIVGKFKNRFPLVKISFCVGGNHFVIDGITHGKFDVGFIGEPCDKGTLTTEHFIKDEICFIAAPSHPLAGIKNLTIDRLSTAKLIFREKGSGTRSLIDDIFCANGIDLSATKLWGEFSSFESIKRLVQAGIGISAMSKWAIVQEVQAGSLKELSVKNKRYFRNFLFVYQSHIIKSTLPLTFIKFCKEQKWDLPSL